jgi:hypothetical protein
MITDKLMAVFKKNSSELGTADRFYKEAKSSKSL